MQLTLRTSLAQHPWLRLVCAALGAVVFLFARPARAQLGTFDTAHTVYYEAPSRTHMFVYTPGVDASATPFDWLSLRAGYEADVVSGASVSTKAGGAYAATHPGADVISTASVHDVRNQFNGGFTLKKDIVTITGGYTFSTEHDYKSNSFFVSARTEPYEHDTQFEISYARNFDRVCDRVQGPNDPPPRHVALEDSTGCFTSAPLRTTRDIGVDGFQASWSQAWTPIFVSQLIYTAQIVNGFQSDPYRSVIVGEGLKAQEYVPDNRARQAVALRGNLFLKPIKAAVHAGVRGYVDTWDVRSVTVDAEIEKYLGEAFRIALHGRYYKQSGALFWSDDYTGGDAPLGPKGQYFTGDRELSPFSSYMVGLRPTLVLQPHAGRMLGFMTQFHLGASADVIQFSYDEYTLGGNAVGDARAYILGLNAGFVF